MVVKFPLFRRTEKNTSKNSVFRCVFPPGLLKAADMEDVKSGTAFSI